ncbi:MAG: NAD(P)H-dependent glycerol-3-phosphate dehydrogenase [Chlamydiales bacterium]
MKICYLGIGCWGYCLATHLAKKTYDVVAWSQDSNLVDTLITARQHPRFKGIQAPPNLSFVHRLEEAIEGADIIVESVTAAGLRSVCSLLSHLSIDPKAFIITSKGIEQDTGLILPEVVKEVLGAQFQNKVGVLSGPSYAEEVINGLPATVVASAYDPSVINQICHLFTNPTFRVYPNHDVIGVCFGGALKNVIAIACGIAGGLNYGSSAQAALITRGLHEMRKLAASCGAKLETLNGLTGLGDLCLTSSSFLSRNYRFGTLLAKGMSREEALKEIEVVVEGAYTCVTALQLSEKNQVPMPITEAVYHILYRDLPPRQAVKLLMERAIKEEHL